jgi:hypothetical protein
LSTNVNPHIPSSHQNPKKIYINTDDDDRYNETHHLIFSRTTKFYTKNEHVILALPPSLVPKIKNLHFIFPLYARAVPDFSFINNHINNKEKSKGTREREMGPNERAWVMVWERVREMRGLKRLYLEFEVPGVWRGIWGREGNERGLRESLRGVGDGEGMESFVMGLPWEREGGREVEGVEREGEIEIVRVNAGSEQERTRSNSFASEGAMIWRREKCFRLEL